MLYTDLKMNIACKLKFATSRGHLLLQEKMLLLVPKTF